LGLKCPCDAELQPVSLAELSVNLNRMTGHRFV
jgi:hypothetical protein